jgi:hypothetical protein
VSGGSRDFNDFERKSVRRRTNGEKRCQPEKYLISSCKLIYVLPNTSYQKVTTTEITHHQ